MLRRNNRFASNRFLPGGKNKSAGQKWDLRPHSIFRSRSVKRSAGQKSAGVCRVFIFKDTGVQPHLSVGLISVRQKGGLPGPPRNPLSRWQKIAWSKIGWSRSRHVDRPVARGPLSRAARRRCRRVAAPLRRQSVPSRTARPWPPARPPAHCGPQRPAQHRRLCALTVSRLSPFSFLKKCA